MVEVEREEMSRINGPQSELETLLLCPMCNLHAGRWIRGKVYCGNCGYIES